MTKKKKKEKSSVWLHILKSPYYLGKGIYRFAKGVEGKRVEEKVKAQRRQMSAEYAQMRVLSALEGEFLKWEENLLSKDSTIGIVLGARGSGKTAFSVKLLENIYAKKKQRMYAMGFAKKDMPSWVEVIEDISSIKNNATVLIDEGGVLFSSRKSMSKPNQVLSELILIARHKNLNILFISQNSSNLDINILRQADFLVLKPTSLLQKDFERKKVRDIYQEVSEEFEKYKEDKGVAYVYANDFRGFVSNPLPSFWSSKISKSFSGKN